VGVHPAVRLDIHSQQSSQAAKNKLPQKPGLGSSAMTVVVGGVELRALHRRPDPGPVGLPAGARAPGRRKGPDIGRVGCPEQVPRAQLIGRG